MNRLAATLLAFAVSHASAQHHIHQPVTATPYMPPSVNMPAGKLFVDKRTIPGKRYGFSDIRILPSCNTPTGNPSTECGGSTYPEHKTDLPGGSFRITCFTSHLSFDDPIVQPGKPGMTHLHAFFGNTTTNAASDAALMGSVGRSTCAGGIANRTGYWVPVVIYVCPPGEVGCDATKNGRVFPPAIVNAYYKTQGLDAAHLTALEWFPVGFRMIAGDPNNTDPARMPGRFDCSIAGNLSPGPASYMSNRIPSTSDVAGMGGCDEVNMLVNFPECWNGTDLYLPTAFGAVQSAHTVYRASGGCLTPGFARTFPNVAFNIHTRVPNAADFDYLMLSSDQGPSTGVTQAGSTTTAVKLAAGESITNSVFVDGFLAIAGQRRRITAYDGTTKTVTLATALSSAPAAGVSYLVRMAGGRSMHGDWANGWNQAANFNGWGRTLTDQIIRSCYFDVSRYGSPVSGTPGSSLNLDCHDNVIGTPDTGPEPAPGRTYYLLY